VNNRELEAVFWTTCALAGFILGLLWVIRLGLDEQRSEERELGHLEGVKRLEDWPDPPDDQPSPRLRTADSPQEQPTSQGQR